MTHKDIEMKNIAYLSFPVCIAILFSGCSGQESAFSQGRGGDNVAEFSLNITDAPVDGVREVWVQITGYSIHPKDGNTLSEEFDPVNINLLSLQGNNSLNLVDRTIVPAGEYSWLRLHVNASIDEVFDSYVTLQDGNSYELNMPSASQSGLKINTPFTLDADVDTSKTIDFDLRKSLVLTGSGKYQLRPTLRLVDDALAGSITGTVDEALISSPDQCSDNDPDTGNAVYVYKGFDVVPEDLNNSNINDVVTTNVSWNDQLKEYVFVVGFLEAGNYTIALTCQADLDDPAFKDTILFVSTENATVEAGQ